jgi:hypothetical protein
MKTTSKISILLLFLFAAYHSSAAVYETVSNGNWNKSSVWSPSIPTMYWGTTDTIIIKHAIGLNQNITLYGHMIINSGASLSNSKKDFTIGASSTLDNNGTLSCKNFVADWGTSAVINNNSISVSANMTLNEGTFVNYGSIHIDKFFDNSYDNTFTNSSGASLTVGKDFISRNDFDNQGTVNVGRNMTNDYSCMMTNAGTINCSSNFSNHGSFSTSGSLVVNKNILNDWSCTFANTGTVSAALDFTNRGPLTNSGSASIDIGDDFVNKGSMNNSASLDVSGSLTNDWGVSLTNTGSMDVGDSFTNKGTTNNTGTLDITNDFTNKSSFNNYNALIVGDKAHNDYGCTVSNYAYMHVVDDFVNNGNISNDGTMEVDGSYNGSGVTTGSGDLCNSDGYTDPTSGAKAVTCNICGDDASGLPVELVQFQAIAYDGYIQLNWTTASEVNNSHFEIYRSFDAVIFEHIGSVQGNGTSNVLIHYSYQDASNQTGTIYYRLRQVDYDGGHTESHQVSVSVQQSLKVHVFPNPANTSDWVQIQLDNHTANTLQIYDLTGKLIYEKRNVSGLIRLPKEFLSRGAYILRVQNSCGKLQVKKLIIQ